PAGKAPAPVRIAIQDFDLCPRYSALVFANVTVKPSPLWLQYRLNAIGLNPINNIVDLTNYIMAEMAQPMHAFDRDLLRGGTIFIRLARTGERIVALNEEEYGLKPSNLVIADESGPIAIAGVIGGMRSAISGQTHNIVLESANFQAASVRRTSVDIELMEELSPGARLVGGLGDEKKEFPPSPEVELDVDWVSRKLGREVSPAEVRDILERLAFAVHPLSPRIFRVKAPSWRATKDVSVKDDLVEEVGRMVGYDSIEPKAPAILDTAPPDDPARLFHRAVRSRLTALGFTEVYNYSFISEEQALQFGFEPGDHVRVANPIASDQSLLRMSLLPGIYKNIVENSKHFDQFRFFEIGREIHKQPSGLPVEIPHVVAAIFIKERSANDLFELKHAAQSLMSGAEVRPATARSFEHPARAGEVRWRGEVVGRLFELHPNLTEGRAPVLDL